MLTQSRHEQILSLLAEKGAVTVSELCGFLGASESTVRRDLLILSQKGKLSKVHGGATLSKKDFISSEDRIETKLEMNMEEKTRIARNAASQIRDDDFVYLDAGSTTILMIDFITAKKATFVTNGIVHAQRLVKSGLKAYVVGGELKPTTEAIIGLAAATNLQAYNFSKAFIGTNGITKRQGYTTPDTDEAFLKTAAMERSFVSYVVADSSKFGRVSTVTFAPLDHACIITDKLTDKEISEKTVVKEVE